MMAAVAVAITSCVDLKPLDFSVTEPQSIADMNYLKEYSPLTDYLAEGSSFKLGVGISADELTAHGVPYRLAAANFNEWVAGNDMKYASVVADDGTMNFNKVTAFVDEARAAGVGVYGHTLVWHAQQRPKWLYAMIKDTDVKPVGQGYAMKIVAEGGRTNAWDVQVRYNLPDADRLTQGTSYTIKFMVKAESAITIPMVMQETVSGGYQQTGTSVNAGSDWSEFVWEFTPNFANGDQFCFNLGRVEGTFYVDNFTLTETGSATSRIPNGDFETGAVTGWGAPAAISADGEGYGLGGGGGGGDGGYALKLSGGTEGAANWSRQAFYKLASPMTPGTNYTITYMAKSTEMSYNLQFFLQSSTTSNQNYPAGVTVNPGGWQEMTVPFSTNDAAMDKITFNFGNLYQGSVFVDNVKMVAEGSSVNLIENGTFEDGKGISGWAQNAELSADGEGYSTTPKGYLPLDKQKEVLTAELERWISGIMAATGADAETGATTYVKAWDLVNEPMDDTNPYALKTNDANKDGQPDNPDSPDFFWQDGMSRDYARIAARLARQYGGNDLKLFVNDYNLEAVYNNNDKARGLIAMVEYWESDGITKIDGIGTQMHVSYNVDPARQKAQEDAIVTMFQLLAATGKLIKVSELDMGINDAEGKAIMTNNVTSDQHKAMAAFYKFIVSKYFELIPAAQRYGITQWAATDSPANSGWRAGQPIGLWDANYNRKHTYAGFADGLAGN
jgi:GH35 family endo-1,4-beta-xylanase